MSQTLDNKPVFLESVAEEIRRWIDKYEGNEVFLIGTCDTDGVVISVESRAFGNSDSVPAPAQMATSGQVLIHNHPSGELQPSPADISIASAYGKAGIGFYITNNTCSEVRVVVKPYFPKEMEPVDFSELEKYFGPEGRLRETFDEFEFRPQQFEMMQTIVEAFNNNQLAVIEAGTGVGKSFAYLAPSILWSLQNKRRVVVSTNTINLQEQLLFKDLPELARQMNREIKAVLVKGRSNYISLRRLKFASTQKDFFLEDRSGELESLKEWAQNTEDGSRSDIPFQVSEDTWDAVMSDKDDCLRASCPMFNSCLFYKSRREASTADIVIANHHIVMADVALRLETSGNDYVGILPPFDRVILDEAHNIEDVATRYFTSETSLFGIRRQLFRISRPRDGTGELSALYNAIRKNRRAVLNSTASLIQNLIIDRIMPARTEAEVGLNQYFDDLYTETATYFNSEDLKNNERREFRVTTAVTESPYWANACRILEGIAESIHSVTKLFDRMDDELSLLPDEFQEDIIEPRLRLYSAVRKLKEHEASLHFFLAAQKDEYCRWFEFGLRRGRPFIYPRTAPLDVSPQLRSALFEKKNTVILTSATLTIDNNFRYFTKQIGLNYKTRPTSPAETNSSALEDRTVFLQLDTPYDFRNNCLIGIPMDLEQPSHRDFYRLIVQPVVEAVRITRGRAMVLFTSYNALRAVADACRQPLMESGITTLQQGDIPRSQLVENFRNTERGALFATSSFWEGVDLQGDTLQCLILTKLPFSVPNTPLLEARAEALERQGGNPFYEISVPQAVIKFKQGFGRLIRSHSDRGIVMILDNRVILQRYGQIFLKSLPPAGRVEGSTPEILDRFRNFFTRHDEF